MRWVDGVSQADPGWRVVFAVRPAWLYAGATSWAVRTPGDHRLPAGLVIPLHGHGDGCAREVSVVGYDDDALSRLAHVALTTVGQDTGRLAGHAVAAIVERLDGDRAEHREVVLQPYLAIRATTAPPRTP